MVYDEIPVRGVGRLLDHVEALMEAEAKPKEWRFVTMQDLGEGAKGRWVGPWLRCSEWSPPAGSYGYLTGCGEAKVEVRNKRPEPPGEPGEPDPAESGAGLRLEDMEKKVDWLVACVERLGPQWSELAGREGESVRWRVLSPHTPPSAWSFCATYQIEVENLATGEKRRSAAIPTGAPGAPACGVECCV